MSALGRRRFHFPVTESTMDDLRALAEAGAPEGTLVRADRQVAGRGRAGRAWSSPQGGLWMSLLLRPDRPVEHWSLLALLAGSSCAVAMERFGAEPRLKWPNDVLLGGRKVAGFLVETRMEEFVLLGCGVNVRVPGEAVPGEVRAVATSLHEHASREVDVDVFLEELLGALSHRYEAWRRGQDEFLCKEWASHADTLGRTVRAESGPVGKAVGVDARGALLVQGVDGQVKSVAWGDVVTASQ